MTRLLACTVMSEMSESDSIQKIWLNPTEVVQHLIIVNVQVKISCWSEMISDINISNFSAFKFIVFYLHK